MDLNGTVFNDTKLTVMESDTLLISEDPNYKPPYSATSIILSTNGTTRELPIDMRFNDGHRLAISVYTLLMIFSAIGNIYVLTCIFRLKTKGKLSRQNLFLLHLTIADLLVTFLMMPLEIGWHYTVSWEAGDLMCRLMSFFRIFGLYLSGFVLVVISLDLFFAVVKPLGIAYADGRAKIMLRAAWFASFIFSVPQSIIFHVEKHPKFKWYEQCVTFNFFPSKEYEVAYNMFSFFFLYVFPLTMIVLCYSCILYVVYCVSKNKANDKQLRRSNSDALRRAKVRTLKMTITIVATFVFCWTPYNVMSLWHWIDSKSAQAVDQRIQKGFFLFACTNSCLNPIIYGFFHFRGNQNRTGSPTSVTNVKRALPLGSKHDLKVQWRENGCCRLEVQPEISGTVISNPILPLVRNVNTILSSTTSDNETRCSSNLSCSSQSSSSFHLMVKSGIKETQV